MGIEDRLTDLIAERRAQFDRPILVGLAGPQGSGKTTLAARLAEQLAAEKLRTAVLALDDFYLTRAERQKLAANVHPLLATRGPPGTHDLARMEAVIAALLAGSPATVPRFDKATDDRAEEARQITPPLDVVLFEGWCVGASPQSDAELVEPVNALERDADPDAVWRRFVNAALAAYQPLFARIDFAIQLRAPSFDTVAQWRWEQEAKLGAGPQVMDRAQVQHFVQFYERITRHMHEDPRGDVVIDLAEDRQIMSFRGPD